MLDPKLIVAVLSYPLQIAWRKLGSILGRKDELSANISQGHGIANPIRITSPRPGEVLNDSRPMSPGVCYRVTGTLSVLPHEHQVWLLVEHLATKQIWPQGFATVSYREDLGTWEGYIYPHRGSSPIRIVAIVATPSAHSLFTYYQDHGDATGWAPLPGIPDGCANCTAVEALVP